MSATSRSTKFKDFQTALGGKPAMSFVTAARQNLNVTIGQDCLPVIYQHLRRFNPLPLPEINLFLLTRGGDTMVPLALHNLMREYCGKVNVIVAAECHSAGTMIALGADNIIMGPYGQLSPIDPTVTHPLNPQAPVLNLNQVTDRLQLVGIGVEQVFAYLSLAKEKAGIVDADQVTKVFEALSGSVHPIALGEIHRVHSLIRALAEKLLRFHITDKTRIAATVETLTEKLFSHGYLIGRREAKDVLDLPVSHTAEPLESAMVALRDEYVADGKMEIPFDLQRDIGATAPTQGGTGQQSWPKKWKLTYEGGFIASPSGESVYTIEMAVTVADQKSQPAVAMVGDWRSTWV
jgi:hypothetical protein